jgi:hypothetical protein
MIKDKHHSFENILIQKYYEQYNPKIIIVDFNNILLSFYYQFIDMLSKFTLTNFFTEIKNINNLYNIVLENFIRFNLVYFFRTKLHIYNIKDNYGNFINKYINYLKTETSFSEKTINYIEKYLNQKINFIPYTDPKLFNYEFIKLINFVIIFTIFKLYIVDLKKNINNLLLIFVIRDDFSATSDNNKHFFDFIFQYKKSKILSHVSEFLSANLNINVNICIQYVKKSEGTSIKTEIDDLHCLNFYINLYNTCKNNIILFSNDKYRKILNAKFNFQHETLFFSSYYNKIIYNLYSENNTINILENLKKNNYLNVYSSSNIKYKDYNFGKLNALIFDYYKNIINLFFKFINY